MTRGGYRGNLTHQRRDDVRNVARYPRNPLAHIVSQHLSYILCTPSKSVKIAPTSASGKPEVALHLQSFKVSMSSDAILGFDCECDCEMEEYFELVQNLHDRKTLKQKVTTKEKRWTMRTIKGWPCESRRKFQKCMHRKNTRQKSPARDFK